MTGRLEEIKRERDHTIIEFGAPFMLFRREYLDWLITEVEQWQANYQTMLEANEENVREVERLRGELDKQIDLNEGYVDTATALREALENEWRIAHNDYCGCSLDGRMKCDHSKPKALAPTEAPQ